MFQRLMGEPTKYLKHYIDLSAKYASEADVYREFAEDVRQQIRELAAKDTLHPKYKTYTEMNPNLEKSPFILDPHPLSKDAIRFRLGSHVLPIETGRWSRKPRQDRVCGECGVLGDERHAIFVCQKVDRTNITLPDQFCDIWKTGSIYEMLERIKEPGFLD